MRRRRFLQVLSALPAVSRSASWGAPTGPSGYSPGRIPNEYSLFLPGEREALGTEPVLEAIERGAVIIRGRQGTVRPGQEVDGWLLIAVASMNGSDTAVFEKTLSHRGAIVYITQAEGVILRIPKGVGNLSNIRPRPIIAPQIQFKRESPYRPGPDRLAEYILGSNEDPCYEHVAALGPEYIGWTLEKPYGLRIRPGLYSSLLISCPANIRNSIVMLTATARGRC
jgi:hypothetical protein